MILICIENQMTQLNRTRKAVRPDLLTGPLDRLDRVSLAGTRCGTCAEASLGTHAVCPNCGSSAVTPLTFSRHGTLWTYTIVRNRPPGDYKGPDPFRPFALGLVELPEGLRVMAPLDADFGDLTIGSPLAFDPFVQHIDSDGSEVIAFRFKKPAGN
jgi:uncharacterized OB-fold protein